MLMTAGFGGGGGSGPEWRDWGWIFSTAPDKNKLSQQNSRAATAFILLTKSGSLNEISGTVQLSKTMTHNGLIIELIGAFNPSSEHESESFPLLMKRRGSTTDIQSYSPNSKVFHRFCGGRSITSPAFKKYPFTLKLPQGEILPPTFTSSIGGVEYLLRVSVQQGRDWEWLGEKSISYFGQLTINSSLHLKSVLETELSVDGGLKALLQLPRKEFLRSENIHFTLKIFDPSQGSVKKVTVYLWNMFSYAKRNTGETITGSSVVDCVTFKRFLKREVISRDGKFSAGKINIPTFVGEGLPKLKISYVIQVNLTTSDKKAFSTQQEIIVGTDSTRPNPTAPDLMPGPSAPLLDLEGQPVPGQPVPGQPSAPMASLSLAASMLSLFPPGYSALSSRTTSTLSLETLPPHYDDI